MAGKVTVGLASHWPCVTDSVTDLMVQEKFCFLFIIETTVILLTCMRTAALSVTALVVLVTLTFDLLTSKYFHGSLVSIIVSFL